MSWGKSLRIKCDRLSSQFRIETGVPIPPPRRLNGGKVRGMASVVRSLRKGNSVLLPISQAHASALASRYIGSGMYETRSYPTGTRIWRTQ